MRTALVLLFLLALAAVPGSVLPQRTVNREAVGRYFAAHPELAPWLDRLGGFDVYASPWFSAVYLLLFTSLVGCVLPRLIEHARALRSAPPDAPRRLERLPAYAAARPHPTEPATTARTAAGVLRAARFRTVLREHPDGSWTVSAEKGYLKEAGNLLFHLSLLAVLAGLAFGSWYGWHGNRVLVAGRDTAFCNTPQQFDDAGFGARVAATDLPGFCLQLDEFTATYQPSGQPRSFDAAVTVEGLGPARTANFTVNAPLRLGPATVYLLGHGYAPVLRYTDRYGRAQTQTAAFLPTDGMITSEGVAMFPDVNDDPRTSTREPAAQVAFEGLYLPTAPDAPPFTRSQFPAERNPALMLWTYRGDLGLDVGLPKSVYQLDRRQIDRGKLAQVGEPRLVRRGEKVSLDDGTTVEFVGTRQWIAISVRHDPAQPVVLAGATLALLGMTLSLMGRRRRVWFRIGPADGADCHRTLVEAGGLPRTEQAGFADEFNGLVRAVDDAATAPPGQIR
ncbi:cytochrome c biogenesis protein [Spirilliplanes yamanashiensis]|uniref:Cytochrome c biogenesis protein n=2 Tax=Spirilliplanes yamanashiensis TaxID=42233 RepID=A0A8J4DMX5_9ACTN|nr:cytochrome c biogenesis protein [Spirilliplanes yamanashiensis]GIJ06645.1 cytochrome c biogenesis protein [Spirilliplanes yamanashiensis]